MPKYYYEYSINGEIDFFIVNHAITRDKLDSLYELMIYFKENKDKVWDSSEEKLNLSEEEIEQYLIDDFKEIKLTRIVKAPNIHFKGVGWFSANPLRYQGKNKRLYEKLRDERSNRKSKNISVADIDKEIGLKSRSVDGIIPDKKWDKLTKEQKNIATEYGIRPSRNYTK